VNSNSRKEPAVPNHPSSDKYRRAFLVLLTATTAFRLFYIQRVERAPDEAYYWTWSRQLFFAYTGLRSKGEANWPPLAYFSAVIALAGISSEEWSIWGKGKRGFAWAAALRKISHRDHRGQREILGIKEEYILDTHFFEFGFRKFDSCL
jgi:hypothetical protein